MEALDLRLMPARVRHEAVFEHLTGLATGQTLRLVSDHDPAPLGCQLNAPRPGDFEWAYVEAGSEEWQVDFTGRARVVDARPTLAAGGEPSTLIMEAAAVIGDREAIVVYAPFEPVALEGVLGERGFTSAAEELDDGDWRVTFVPGRGRP